MWMSMFWLKRLRGYSSSSLCFQATSGGPFTRPFGLGAAMHSSERRKTDVTLTVVQHIPARRGDLMTLLSLLTRGADLVRLLLGAIGQLVHPCWVSAKS